MNKLFSVFPKRLHGPPAITRQLLSDELTAGKIVAYVWWYKDETLLEKVTPDEINDRVNSIKSLSFPTQRE